MAVEEQTTLRTLAGSLVETVVNIFHYVVCAVKLYIIGVLALLLQLLGKPAPVKGLQSQKGRTAVVTGGASGIGLHLSKQLASLGASVIIASRDKEEAEKAINIIQQECSSAKVKFMELDLASFSSVKRFVANFQATGSPLHILINNGGIMLLPHQTTQDGHEYHLQVNHLSHALLTSLLTNNLQASSHAGCAARVVNVSSVVHHVAALDCERFGEKQHDNWSYSPHNAYAVSKLAILLYTYALSRHWVVEGSKVTVNAVHPGVVNTNLYQHVHWSLAWIMNLLRQYFFMSPETSALSVLHVATSPELEGVSGCYFSHNAPCTSSSLSHTPSVQEAVYNKTQHIIGKMLY